MASLSHVFYGTNEDPAKGMKHLNSLIQRDVSETAELIKFLVQRIQTEENYSLQLKNLVRTTLKDDPQRVSVVVFRRYISEMSHLCDSHTELGQQLKRLLDPLHLFINEVNRQVTPRFESILKGWTDYQTQLKETVDLQDSAQAKSLLLNQEENVQDQELLNKKIQIGDFDILTGDLNILLRELQTEVESADIWHLFGNYKDCYCGSKLHKYLIDREWRDCDALGLLNYLIETQVLNPINGKAPFQYQNQYQWTKLEIGKEITQNAQMIELNYLMFKIGKSSKKLEIQRLGLEIQMQEFCKLASKALSRHIKLFKHTLTACLQLERIPIDSLQIMHDRLGVFIESLDPERELLSIIENEKTGIKPQSTFVPKQITKIVSQYIFGVSLEEHCEKTKTKMPTMIKKLILYLQDTYQLSEQTNKNKSLQLDCWLEQYVNLQQVHQLRELLNGGDFQRKILRKFPPEIIVGVLKLYLIELPVSVCSEDLYNSLKMVYLSSIYAFNVETEDSLSNRLSSVRNMLATMSSSHFNTLAYLSTYWQSLIVHLGPMDAKVTQLSQVLGPYVLRPIVKPFFNKVNSNITVNDMHPQRLVRDLIVHTTELISPEVLGVSDSQENLDEISEDDEEASIRPLWDAKHENTLKKKNSMESIASSFKSHWTKKTGYSLTIAPEENLRPISPTLSKISQSTEAGEH